MLLPRPLEYPQVILRTVETAGSDPMCPAIGRLVYSQMLLFHADLLHQCCCPRQRFLCRAPGIPCACFTRGLPVDLARPVESPLRIPGRII